jgi:hypothetical protein
MKTRELQRGAAHIVAAIMAAVALSVPAEGQVSNASAAAAGMGFNYTAAARGYAATAWNPAGLALSGNPGWSFQALTVRGIAGVDPVTLGDIADYGGEVVPSQVKAAWLNEITAEGSQQGTSGFDVNWLSVQAGHFGVQVNTSGTAVANISPGIAQLLLFGNADSSGTPQDIDLSHSSMDVNAYSTLALAYAMPFTLGNGAALSVGVTAKYTRGHFMVMGAESTGSATADPASVRLEFPIVHTPLGDDEGGFDATSGGGVGIDIGAGYEMGAWAFGATVRNVFNTFEWDADKLYYRPGTLVFDQSSSESDFESEKLTASTAGVPAALRQRIEDQKFKPVISAGAAYQASAQLRATADARFGSDAGIRTGAKTHVGAGIEYRVLPWLPLRLGAAVLQLADDDSGSQMGGGIGADVAGFNLSAAVSRRSTGLGHDTSVMFTLFSR